MTVKHYCVGYWMAFYLTLSLFDISPFLGDNSGHK